MSKGDPAPPGDETAERCALPETAAPNRLGADPLAHQPRERRSAAAVEISLESVADRFVQHHARPARPEHHVHLAGGRRHGFEIGERLPDRLVDRPLPGARLQETLITLAPAVAVAAGFLAIARAGDHRDIDPHERPYVAVGAAVGGHDLDPLPGRAEADRYLLDPRVYLARVSVDGFEQLDLGLEARRAERVLVVIEPDVGARRRLGVAPGVAAANGAARLGGARERLFGQVRGMGIAD